MWTSSLCPFHIHASPFSVALCLVKLICVCYTIGLHCPLSYWVWLIGNKDKRLEKGRRMRSSIYSFPAVLAWTGPTDLRFQLLSATLSTLPLCLQVLVTAISSSSLGLEFVKKFYYQPKILHYPGILYFAFWFPHPVYSFVCRSFIKLSSNY